MILTILIIIIILFLILCLNKKEQFVYKHDDIHSPARDAFSRDLNERINIVTK